jgi:hypothetical protein
VERWQLYFTAARLAERFPLVRMMPDGVPRLRVFVPDGPAADRFIADARSHTISMDADDILNSL